MRSEQKVTQKQKNKKKKGLAPNMQKFSPNFKSKRKQRLNKWKLKEKFTKIMLKDFWQRACEQATVPLEVATKWFQQIMNRYDSNCRYYHNDKLLNFKMSLLDPNVGSHIVFAIFFQYYEFDVRDFGYVENCAAFSKFYDESGIDNQILLESVLQLRFNNKQIENDLLYFQDMDLAIFGSPSDEYKMYANQLQKEYVHMDENTYKSMRLKILSMFLTIPNIYSTESFRDKFEDIARTNINNETSELKK